MDDQKMEKALNSVVEECIRDLIGTILTSLNIEEYELDADLQPENYILAWAELTAQIKSEAMDYYRAVSPFPKYSNQPNFHGYPLWYMSSDSRAYCADCANAERAENSF